MAVPVWQPWQLGSMNHPTRFNEPTALIPPWQLWHCMAMVPSRAMGGVVERDAQLWIEHGGVLRVDGRGQRRDGAEAAGTERLGGVARGADHGLAVRAATA